MVAPLDAWQYEATPADCALCTCWLISPSRVDSKSDLAPARIGGGDRDALAVPRTARPAGPHLVVEHSVGERHRVGARASGALGADRVQVGCLQLQEAAAGRGALERTELVVEGGRRDGRSVGRRSRRGDVAGRSERTGADHGER